MASVLTRRGYSQVNKRGLKLQCSHYKPSGATPEHALPVVIYCHCNSGSRRDAEEAFYVLLPHNITVFCLDFAVSTPAPRSQLCNGPLRLRHSNHGKNTNLHRRAGS